MQATLLASAARTVTGSQEFKTDGGKDLRVYLDVTAVGGTAPTLDVVVRELVGSVEVAAATFAQKTAAGQEVLLIQAPRSGSYRVDYTIGGTVPSFTFSVHATQE